MKRFSLLILVLFSAVELFAQGFEEKTIDVGNIGLNVTSVGAIGRPNVRNTPTGAPSMEYPLNSGIEHLFEAGLWIGALVNGQISVSTGSIDDPTGYSTGKSGFEFTPIPNKRIIERSSLTSSERFSLSAISHQDYEILFTDSFTIVPGTNQPINNHTLPLFANVKLQTYAWNFSFADFFVILNYEITNNSQNNWDSVYLGIWSDLIVRNVNVATDGGAAFFNKGSLGFEDSLKAIYAYDVSGDPGFTESYGALQFLGIDWRGQYFHPTNAQSFINQGFPAPEVNGNYWLFNQQAPTDDLQRYDRMKTHADFSDPSLMAASNRVQLITAGPIVQIAPGETVNLAFGVVCAKQLPDNPKDSHLARTKLRENLGWAKRTFVGEDLNENGQLDSNEDLNENNELDRYILPEPPATPQLKVIPEENKVTIYWDEKAENSIDPISKKKDFEGYKIYRTKIGDDLGLDLINSAQLIAQWDKKGNNVGFNNGFGEITLNQIKNFEGDTTDYKYKFEVNNLLNGWQYLFIVTAFDEGDEALGLPTLESSFVQNANRVFPGTSSNDEDELKVGVYPNPYRTNAAWDGTTSRSRKMMFYNLPSEAEITIYTISGDVVAVLRHNSSQQNNGSEIGWYNNFGADDMLLAGGEHAWDLLSDNKQSITTGLYLYSVKNLKTGKIQTGKFSILK